MKTPQFLDDLKRVYNEERKNVAVLTGDIHGLFWDQVRGEYYPLESALNQSLKEKRKVIRFDFSGINVYDQEIIKEIDSVIDEHNSIHKKDGKEISHFKETIEKCRYEVLPNLVYLKQLVDVLNERRRIEKELKKDPNRIPKLCIIIQFAGAIFPEGNFNHLSELDRGRLVFFLSWLADPMFSDSEDLIVLVNPLKTEINGKILSLPNVEHIELQLPEKEERKHFVELFITKHPNIKFEDSLEKFVEVTAGLTIPNIRDLLLVAETNERSVRREDVIAEVNKVLQARLGDIIKIKYPTHKPTDIIGYDKTKEILASVHERCEDPETAISAIIVSGPNGGGKTYQCEAFAAISGRVVVELGNIRGSFFGETDQFFELLRFYITTLGKIEIMVDEAHTAFGSVHDSNTHETEKRLSGNVIKMMGDPRYFGKIIWVLMTSRPDELDPDIKSRAPIQIPIFDLEGDERKQYVLEAFKRKDIDVGINIDEIQKQTDYYSNRDMRDFIKEVLAQRKKKPNINPLDVLKDWQASRSIKIQRHFQELIALQHCSYPKLIPERLKMDDEEVYKEIEELKFILQK